MFAAGLADAAERDQLAVRPNAELLRELAPGGGLERLAVLDQPLGDAPSARILARPLRAAEMDQQDLELVPTDIPVFDTGFDHEATLENGVVSGVVPGGSAERAGLADGMRIRSWSVSYGRIDVPIKVRVATDAEEREISFLPLGTPVAGYAFRVRDPR